MSELKLLKNELSVIKLVEYETLKRLADGDFNDAVYYIKANVFVLIEKFEHRFLVADENNNLDTIDGDTIIDEALNQSIDKIENDIRAVASAIDNAPDDIDDATMELKRVLAKRLYEGTEGFTIQKEPDTYCDMETLNEHLHTFGLEATMGNNDYIIK